MRPMAARAMHFRVCRRAVSTISAPSTAASSQSDAEALGRFFYRNRHVERWGSKPAVRMTLRQLIMYSQSARRNSQLLLDSANFVRTELATRIAHRIRDMQTLPMVVMSNDKLDTIYQHYWRTFEMIRQLNRIKTIEQNEELVHYLSLILSSLNSKLALLVSITQECSQYMRQSAVDVFIGRMLRSQISREILARQHMALWAMQGDDHAVSLSSTIGVIDTRLDVTRVLRESAANAASKVAHDKGWAPGDAHVPAVVFDGDLDVHMAYLPTHLEFIATELIKLALQDTIQSRTPQAPVQVTIVAGPPKADLIVRVSYRGGGLKQPRPEHGGLPAAFARGPLLIPGSSAADAVLDPIWSFANIARRIESKVFDTEQAERQERVERAARESSNALASDSLSTARESDALMRLTTLSRDAKSSLPIVRLYAEIFGGGLEFRTMDGYGTDFYLRLPKFGTTQELHE